MRRLRVALVSFVAAVIISVSTVTAEDRLTEHTLQLSEGEKPAPATISDFAWMTGHWTSEALGGFAEEIWGPPRNGVMLGMFRLNRNDKPAFYELITVAERDGSLLMQLKHFNPDLTGWEEKDKTVDFPLVSKSKGTFHFEGLTIRREVDDNMTLFLALRQKNGSHREETFRYKRAPKSPSGAQPKTAPSQPDPRPRTDPVAAQLQQTDQFEKGRAAWNAGMCVKCHKEDAKGGPRAPDLTDHEWFHCDGTVDGILTVLRNGVKREQMKNPNRPYEMSPVTPDEVDLASLAAYVHSLSQHD